MVAPRKLTEHFVSTLVDDEIVLIDMEGGELFSLKGTARAVWEAIDGIRTLDEIAGVMVKRFDVAKAEALNDIGELLNELAEAKLLEN